MDLYGAGLERLLEVLDAAGPAGEGRCAGRSSTTGSSPACSLIHGLYPVDLETRVAEALETVRPYMHSHGGNVEVLGFEEGVVRLRLEGSCSGCPGSTATLESGHPAGARGGRAGPRRRRGRGARRPRPLARVNPPQVPSPGAAPRSRGAARDRAALVGAMRALRTDRRPSPEAPDAAGDERCELCAMTIPEDHKHLLHLDERRILCVCSSCWAIRSGDAEFRPAGNRTVRAAGPRDARRAVEPASPSPSGRRSSCRAT